jgi:hypothetical protein
MNASNQPSKIHLAHAGTATCVHNANHALTASRHGQANAERWRAGSDAMGFASIAGFRIVGYAFGGRDEGCGDRALGSDGVQKQGARRAVM